MRILYSTALRLPLLLAKRLDRFVELSKSLDRGSLSIALHRLQLCFGLALCFVHP